MRVAISTVVLIAAVLSVSGCQESSKAAGSLTTTAGVTQPAVGSAAPTTEPAGQVQPGGESPITQETTTQKAPVADSGATACDSVTPAILQQTAVNSHASTGPLEFKQPQCVQGWAMAWSKQTTANPQPSGYLFRATSTGTWRYITVGSAIDCTTFGVPHDVAVQLKGCRS
ncbi:hypothetical protein [Nocardia sp. NPDC004123]